MNLECQFLATYYFFNCKAEEDSTGLGAIGEIRFIARELFKPLTATFSGVSVRQILGGAQHGTCVLLRSWGMPVRL